MKAVGHLIPFMEKEREAEEARMRELGLEITEEVSLRLMLHFIQFCYFRADFWALLS